LSAALPGSSRLKIACGGTASIFAGRWASHPDLISNGHQSPRQIEQSRGNESPNLRATAGPDWKLKGCDGSEVEGYLREGKIKEVADYCETDVVGAYKGWPRCELFRGTLNQNAFEASERSLADFMTARSSIKNSLYRYRSMPWFALCFGSSAWWC
jgi:predicted PolB exonuclease-like 3'-5' exonuclease